MEQQIQELAETIQQLRQAQLTLTAENERLREGQAGVQALVFEKGYHG
jgi:cell division protein FtsB